MATKQSTFRIAHSTVVPRNYRPAAEEAEDDDDTVEAGETDDA